MIVRCKDCNKRFNDEFRTTICPHPTFAANDGNNNFRHHPESYLEGEIDEKPSAEESNNSKAI